MAIHLTRNDSEQSDSKTSAPFYARFGWGKATLGIASVMLLPDSADAQSAPVSSDLPQVRVTAPKRQAKRQQVRRAPVAPGPRVAAPNDAASNAPALGDGSGVAGYRTPTQSSSSRYPVPFLNTPQTVNVVTQQLMQDQRTTTVQEALRNVPGITFSAGEGGTQGDNITIRGYSARNDVYRDGIRDPGWYFRDTFAIDRVEVYKGPSSFLFGRGSTGGVINLVSKLPQYRDFTILEGTASSSPGVRATVDFNRAYGDWATRLIVMGNYSEVAGRDFTNTQRLGVAPSVSYKINDQMKDTLSYIYQKDDIVPDRGIILLPGEYFGTSYRQPAPVSRNTYYGSVNPALPDTEQTDAHTLNNKYEFDIVPGVKFTNITGFSYVDRFNRTRPVQLSGFGTTTSNLWNAPVGGTRLSTPTNPLLPTTFLGNVWIANTNHFQNQTTNQLVSNVSDLTAKFNTGILEHNVLVGAEISYEDRKQYRTNITDDGRINVLNPNPYLGGTLAATSSAVESNATAAGVYLQDQIKITQWLELLGGVRFDNFKTDVTSYTITRATGLNSGFATLNADNNFVSYRAGVVFHPTEYSSIYYMHGTSANPPAEFLTLANGQQSLDPVKSEIDEVGAKAEILDKRLTLSASVFQIKKTGDYENQGTSTAPQYVAIGDTRVRGFEIGATGKITNEWSVFGGYAYLESTVLNSLTVANVGNELGMTPKNSFSVFTTYAITPAITIGGGAFYVDKRWTSVANNGMIPDYWRFDAMASYQVNPNLLMQLNVYNIADTFYYESAAGAGYGIPGTGRYVALTAKATF